MVKLFAAQDATEHTTQTELDAAIAQATDEGNDVFENVADDTARDALVATQGDVAVYADRQAWKLTGVDPANPAHWQRVVDAPAAQIVDPALSGTSTNPVANQAIKNKNDAQDTAIDAKSDQAALDAEIAETDSEVAALLAGQLAQDTAIALKADQSDLDVEIAATDTEITALQTEQVAQDAAIALKVDQAALDVEIADTDAEITAIQIEQATQNADIALKADKADLDAEVLATDGEITALQDEQVVQNDAIALKADQVVLDAEIARATDSELLRELLSNKTTSIRADGVADDTFYPSEKAVRDALSAMDITGQFASPASPTYAGLPTIIPSTGEAVSNGDWSFLSADDIGTGTAQAPQYPQGVYVTDGATYSFAFSVGMDVSNKYETPVTATELAVNTYYSGSTETWTLPTTPNDGDWVLVSNHAVLLPVPPGLLDKVTVIGPLRIGSGTDIPGAPLAAGTTVRFVYKASIGRWRAAFNFGVFEALTDIHSGMELRSGVTYEIDSKAVGVELFLPEAQLGSIRVRLANGSTHPVTIRQAAAETLPAVIRNHVNEVNDSLLIDIDNTGKVAEFAGYADANRWLQYLAWDTVSQTTNILDHISVRIRSSGTNAGSNIGLTFFDVDGDAYPDGDWVYSANLVQYAGGTATIITDKAPWLGTLGVGRNKDGTVDFYHVGPNPNGLSRVEVPSATSTVAGALDVNYEGTNYSDNFANWADLSQPLYWTTRGVVEASDQAAPFIEATEYAAKSVFSFPEPDAADPDVGVWFNWRVKVGQTVLDTDVPTGTAAEFEAIKPKLDRFGVGSATDDAWLALADTGTPEINRVNVLANEGETFTDPATAGLAVRDKFTVVEPQGATKSKALTRYWDGAVYRTIEEDAPTTKWVYSTDGMNAVDGDKIIVAPNHTINLTDVTDLASIEFAPSTGNWEDIQAGTGSFSPDAAWTFGAGQTLPYGSDVLRVVSNLGNTNWLLFTGGEDAPSQDQRYATVPDLPPIATVNPGAVGVVYNDPTPANNRAYIARTDGVDATVAVAWA